MRKSGLWLVGLLGAGASVWPLWQLGLFSLGSEMYSHVLLVPLVSIYLIRTMQDRDGPKAEEPGAGRLAGGILAGVGVALLGVYHLIAWNLPGLPGDPPAAPARGGGPAIERGYRQSLEAYGRKMTSFAQFEPSDFSELPLLAQRLASPATAEASWIQGQLAPATRGALQVYLKDHVKGAEVERLLAQDLNRILRGPSIRAAEPKTNGPNVNPPPQYVFAAGSAAQVFLNRSALDLVLKGSVESMRRKYKVAVQNSLAVGGLGLVLLSIGTLVWWKGVFWAKARVFPLAFLLFCVPLPMPVEYGMEVFFQHTSAWMMRVLSGLAGVHMVQLSPLSYWIAPFHGDVITVAEECSGIRSTWVLFMTSLLAGYLFLVSRRRRWLLVLLVVPLGILRNGIRITVLNVLVQRYGPEMLDTWIHHQGGPIFFALSLVPFFLVLAWMRRGEARDEGGTPAGDRSSIVPKGGMAGIKWSGQGGTRV